MKSPMYSNLIYLIEKAIDDCFYTELYKNF